MRRSNFRRPALAAAARTAGDPTPGFHHTRHTAATDLLLAGEPVHQVAGILDHASASVTLDVYSHYVPRVAGAVAGASDLRQSESS